KLIASSVDINFVEEHKAIKFIDLLIAFLDEKDCLSISTFNWLLINLRRQNKKLTNQLDLKISEKLPDFYKEDYLLETTDNSTINLETLKKYIKKIYF
ncbi:hypothetical protein DK853_31345, partial [Klebsiella oxytoca]